MSARADEDFGVGVLDGEETADAGSDEERRLRDDILERVAAGKVYADGVSWDEIHAALGYGSGVRPTDEVAIRELEKRFVDTVHGMHSLGRNFDEGLGGLKGYVDRSLEKFGKELGEHFSRIYGVLNMGPKAGAKTQKGVGPVEKVKAPKTLENEEVQPKTVVETEEKVEQPEVEDNGKRGFLSRLYAPGGSMSKKRVGLTAGLVALIGIGGVWMNRDTEADKIASDNFDGNIAGYVVNYDESDGGKSNTLEVRDGPYKFRLTDSEGGTSIAWEKDAKPVLGNDRLNSVDVQFPGARRLYGLEDVNRSTMTGRAAGKAFVSGNKLYGAAREAIRLRKRGDYAAASEVMLEAMEAARVAFDEDVAGYSLVVPAVPATSGAVVGPAKAPVGPVLGPVLDPAKGSGSR